ncbi:MAG: aldehyde dehydrogenase [Bacteroidales bacterium]|nr:aldehyde dehydrogenase [Bacteroidales bacterium]
MENTQTQTIERILTLQKNFLRSGETRALSFRKKQLKAFAEGLDKWSRVLQDALWKDLHKSAEEAYLTEISMVRAEIRTHIAHVSKWASRERKSSPAAVFPSRSYIVKEPLGNALIISPWNYPVQLLLNPLVGAISAGCTAVLKPSPYVPNVARAVEDMVKDTFDEKYIAVVQGDRTVNQALLDQRWDIIFFTGSPSLGRKVMEAASKNLTPVILELGGKSPCIVDRSADIDIAARRIAWGKTMNAGQTCVAPDYILIHEDIKQAFIEAFARAVKQLHGDDIRTSPHFVRIVSDKAFDRVVSYMDDGRIVYGGRSDKAERFVEPTLLDDVRPDSPVMTEEIFGPIFPLITIKDNGSTKDGPASFKQQVADFVNSREKPLAFYWYGNEKDGWDVIGQTSSGGGCINDCLVHLSNDKLPFGGVGNSGMGHYHGKESFLAFTHERSIIASPTWIDLPFRYMPYKLFAIIKSIL